MPSAPWDVLLHRRLPVAAIEALRRDGERIETVKAAGVDVDLVRVGTRHIERMDAAHLAEMMLGDLGVELIGREIARALQQIEPLGRHDQVPDALLGADRAVADGDAVEVGGDAEAYAAAMASAFHGLHRTTLTRSRRRRTTRTATDRAPARRGRDA